MIDDIIVFDNVLHVNDQSDDNLDLEEPTTRHMVNYGHELNLPVNKAVGSPTQMSTARRWTPDELYELEFADGCVDLAMAQAIPIYGWYKNGAAPYRAQYEMAQKYPDQVLFCGGVDPLRGGLEQALRDIEYQIGELGAKSMKFYNGHIRSAWSCDDPELAYPMYEKIGEMGVTVLQFHKGVPFGQQNVEPLRPNDLQRPARDFPDLKFLCHHFAVPYVEEAFNIASRFPNIYLVGSGLINLSIIRPRLVQNWLGAILADVGVEKLIWGSETPVHGKPTPFLRDFMNLQIPEDLQDGWGFPEITHEDRRKILGGNFARIMGIDIEARRAEFAARSKQAAAASA